MSALESALDLIRRFGVAPVPLAFMGKVPVDPNGEPLSGWPNLRIVEETAPAHFPGRSLNVGGLLGQASGMLVDVDLDCPEAIAIAPRFLSPTASFGRASAPRSHWLYRASDANGGTRHSDPNRKKKTDGKAMLVELRVAGQTVMPGSVHESGESIGWNDDKPIATAPFNELVTAVRRVGAAALLARYFPSAPWQEPAAHALAGGLVQAGWDHDDAWVFVTAILAVAAPHVDLDMAEATASGGFPELQTLMNTERAKRALSFALGILELGEIRQPSVDSLATADEEETASLKSIPMDRRTKYASRYLGAVDPDMHRDGSGQLIRLAALVVRGFAVGIERGHELLWEHFVVRHGLKWSQLEVYKRARDAMRGPSGGIPMPWGTKVLESARSAAQDWKSELATTKDGTIATGVANVMTVFARDPAWKDVLQHDIFREEIKFTRTPPCRAQDAFAGRPDSGEWTDNDDVRTVAWMRQQYDFEPTKTTVADAVAAEAEKRKVHPVQEYLSNLNWDGVERLPTVFVRYFGAEDTPYIRGIGVCWMISAVARVMDPGCKVDYLIVLEGPQGRGKTTGLEKLVPQRSWFADTGITIGNKDSYLSLRGKMLYVFDELDSIRGSEVTKTKTFLSSTSDYFRPPYARRAKDFPRQTIFAATTNESSYLKDRTGNRRFWPVKCGRIDVDAIGRDRDLLWAEARVRYGRREQWWPNDELGALCENEQVERVIEDPWLSMIADWLERPVERSDEGMSSRPFDTRKGVTTHEVLLHALGRRRADCSRTDAMRVGDILRELGYRPHQVREGQGRVRRYVGG